MKAIGMYERSIDSVMLTPVTMYPRCEAVNSGRVVTLKDLLASLASGDVKDDYVKYSSEEKSSLPYCTVMSSARSRAKDVPSEPNGLIFIDIDTFKDQLKSGGLHYDEFIEKTDSVVNYLRSLDEYVADWQSSGCGIHCILAAYNEDWEADASVAKYQIKTILERMNSLLRAKFGCEADLSFKNGAGKQGTYLPCRHVHITDKKILKVFNYGYEASASQAKPVVHPSRPVTATDNEYQEALLKIAEQMTKKILSPRGHVNDVFMMSMRDLGRYVAGDELNINSPEVIDEAKEMLIQAAIDSTGDFGGGRSDVREGRIRTDAQRHFSDGYHMGEPKYLYISSMDQEQPREETIDLVCKELAKDFIIEENKTMNEEIDLYNQPEYLKEQPEAIVKKMMLDAFLKEYRVIPGIHERAVEIKTGRILEASTFNKIKKLKWEALGIVFSKRGPVTQTVEIKLGSILEEPVSDVTEVKLIHAYDKPPMSCVIAKPVGERVEVPCYNNRPELLLEGCDLKQKIDPESVEAKKVSEIMQFIANRFDKKDSPEKSFAYYAKYMIDMCDRPYQPPKTGLCFFHENMGTGKTTLGYNIPTFLVGMYHTQRCELKNRSFAQGFEEKLLAYFDEVTSAGMDMQDNLKRLMDARTATIDKKYRDPITVDNVLRITCASNRPNNFELDNSGDRRWTVFSLPYYLNEEEVKIGCMLDVMSDGNDRERVELNFDIDKVRIGLYQALKAYYEKWEADNNEVLSIHLSMVTNSRKSVVENQWTKKPIIRIALDLLSNPEGSYTNPEKSNETWCFADIHHHRNLMKLIMKRGSSDIRDMKWTPKFIKNELLQSKLFCCYLDSHTKGTDWSLTPDGLQALDDETQEQLLNYQSRINRGIKDREDFVASATKQ